MSASDIALPRGKTGDSLYLWAQSLVNTLRRNNVRLDAVATEVETDNEEALAAMETYAGDVQGFINDAGGVAQSVYDQYAAAAAAGHAKLADHYLTQAANTVEQSVRIAENGVTAERIDTLSAYLAGTGATITTIETAVANGDTAIATRIDTVETQAGGNSAAIQTITNSAGGTDANVGFIATTNGQIRAAFNLSTGTQGSNVTFIADKFIIAHPSTPATLITPFVVGLVNGVSTVGITGNVVIDGTVATRHLAAASVTAAKIDVSSLSAITADVGTITAGVLRSSDSKFVIDLNNKTITITT